ncbi:GNAT family N-acetyltransferase [Kribbella sp. NBC_01484]|uniref:GNAT family N-acetyltransferase n=1 Tax=Kribbella sp. NBC_01484 TaxID=2903579 RepID=UPI003FA58805
MGGGGTEDGPVRRLRRSDPVGITGKSDRAAQLSWRIASSAGDNGYAGEAARICLTLAFDIYDLTEVVSAAPLADTKTQRVLQRIGMTRDPADDFDHPGFGPGHPLERHVLYRAGRKH